MPRGPRGPAEPADRETQLSEASKRDAMVTIEIDGMACGGCEDAVVDALTDVAGVEAASADHEAGTASVEGDADTDALAAAVERAGYEPAF